MYGDLHQPPKPHDCELRRLREELAELRHLDDLRRGQRDTLKQKVLRVQELRRELSEAERELFAATDFDR